MRSPSFPCSLPRRLGTLCLALVCALSCGPRPEGPRLDKVSPDGAFFGTPERLLLSGAFAPDLAVDLGSDAPPSLENRFEVRIGPERAYAVRFLSRDTLEATAPATLPPGRHDITVTDAHGHASTLPGAFEVVDHGVHHLVFVTSMRSAHTGEWTDTIRLELRDDKGRPAPTSIPRTLRLTSDSSTGRFARLGETEGQAELEVTLAPGESGVDVKYRNTTPGYHTLESSSLELPPISQTVAVGRLGPPAEVRFTRLPSAPVEAGQPAALAVDILDASGGPAALPATGLQLELGTSSPAGGLAVSAGDPYHQALTLRLTSSQGRLPLLYLDTRAAAEVRLSARAFNRDTLAALRPDDVNLVVRPGPPHRIEVLRAGTGPAQVGVPERFTLQALDRWGNPAPYTGPVRLETFPLDPDFSPGRVELKAGLASFHARFTRVRPVSVMAKDPASTVSGVSEELPLRPGPPARLEVSTVERTQLAGRPFSLALEVLDEFGNRTDTPLSVTLSAAGLPAGALSPSTTGSFTGALTLPVTLTAAAEQTHLLLTEGTTEAPGALRTTTGSFAVLPGPTQRFVVEDTAGTQTAGVPFRVRLRAVDTYGNTTRDVHDLDLDAENVHAHLFSPDQLSGFQGQADVEITLSQAISATRVHVASVSGALKGQQTGLFAVNPGAFARFTLQPPTCVAEGDRWRLTLRAVDTWNNLVTSYTGAVRLALKPSGTISPSATRPFSAGTTTESNVSLSGVAGEAPNPCLELIATDTLDPGKQGTVCLNLQSFCPKGE